MVQFTIPQISDYQCDTDDVLLELLAFQKRLRDYNRENDIKITVNTAKNDRDRVEGILNTIFYGKIRQYGAYAMAPGFLLAALVEEKLLVPMQGKKRSHEPVSPEEFRE